MKNIFSISLLSGQTSKISIQFFRYVIVGGVSAVVDISIFMLCITTFHMHYLVAQTFGFIIGITLNYFLSILWIFESIRKKTEETILFLITGIIGLFLSYVLLWVLIDIFHLTVFNNLIAKIISIVIVLGWNFTSRKFFIFK